MILLFALLPLLQDAPAPRPVPGQSPEAESARQAKRSDVLERRAVDLPRAVDGAWSTWRPGETPSIHLRTALDRANRAYGTGDLATALDGYWDVLTLSPEYPPVLHQVGAVYFRLRRYGDTIACMERFLHHAPHQIGTTRALGHAYYSLGRYEQARVHYERLLHGRPDEHAARRGLALTYAKLGRTDQALEAFEAVLEARPEHAEARAQYAETLFDAGRTEDALAAARRAVETYPYGPRAWFVLARASYEIGDDEGGDAAYAKFVLLDRVVQQVRSLERQLLVHPERRDMLLAVLDLHREVGNIEGVRDVLRRLVASEPTSPRWSLHALDVLYAMGDSAGAATVARHLEAEHADIASVWESLLRYYGVVADDAGLARARAALRRLGSGD